MEPMVYHWHLRLVRKRGKALSDAQPVTEWLKTMTLEMVIKELVQASTRCCVCWEGQYSNPKVKDHGALHCPLIASFNKVCKGANLTPGTLTGTGLVLTMSAAPLNVEAELKKVIKRMAEYEEQQNKVAEDLKKLTLAEGGDPQSARLRRPALLMWLPRSQRGLDGEEAKGRREDSLECSWELARGRGSRNRVLLPPPTLPMSHPGSRSGMLEWPRLAFNILMNCILLLHAPVVGMDVGFYLSIRGAASLFCCMG
jgi:hypothetical protein